MGEPTRKTIVPHDLAVPLVDPALVEIGHLVARARDLDDQAQIVHMFRLSQDFVADVLAGQAAAGSSRNHASGLMTAARAAERRGLDALYLYTALDATR